VVHKASHQKAVPSGSQKAVPSGPLHLRGHRAFVHTKARR
jgi:hypothetical protein